MLPCGQCYNQFDRTLSKLFSLPFEFIYFPKYLYQNLDKIKFTKEINKTITLHDSCKIARGMKDFDTLRGLLKEIPGITLVEMERNREKSICCGGLKNFSYPELTGGLLRERLEQAHRVKAHILVADCTLCYSMYATLEDFYPFEIKHYNSLIAEAMGLKPKDDLYKELIHMEKESIMSTESPYAGAGGEVGDDMEKELDSFMGIVEKLRSKIKQKN